ncbi:UNVERIFIED_CONTAM: hypothetical protein RMT77_019269 [Armadillidium vulgare]
MEYASHIWGRSTHATFLEIVESRAFRLIYSPALINSFQSLSASRTAASVPLYYRYFNGHCSSELSRRIPPPLRRARATLLSTQSYPFSAQLSDPCLIAELNLTCSLLVKSGTHSLHLFSQIPMTYTPSKAVYRDMSTFNLTRILFFSLTLVKILEDLWLFYAHQR